MEEMTCSAISLKLIHWLFYLTFLTIAPFTQYLYDYQAWGYYISIQDYLLVNLLILIWGVLFRICSGRTTLKQTTDTYDRLVRTFPPIKNGYLVVLFFISLISTTIVVVLVGFSNLFSVVDYDTGLDKTFSLLFETIVRPVPVFSTAVAIIFCRQKKKFSLWVPIFLTLALISDFPTAIPRFAMACQYGGIIILLFRSLLNKKGIFVISFLLVFLIIFPASNTFKWNGFELSVILQSIDETFRNISRGFCAVDYDAYSVLVRTIQYVSDNGITWGRSLITVIFFFVPRAIWPGKMEASGEVVAAVQGQDFTNLSSPLPAEGYINFGIFGLIIFAIVYGLLVKKVDCYVFMSGNLLSYAYCFILPISFYLLRGALLSGWAYTFG